ncbi:replication initiation protein [Planomicrobium okeanokoites]|uniref:replication initiation protein n=1 Tax=Planomicrobium okeanokoites TaxID=244 RepID=UPI0024915DA6|nr:replication initiation protein [Planomicrobium okeanokoites]
MNENYLVTQGNSLIEARQKKPLTVREQKLILVMVSMIEPTDDDFKDYEISIRDFHRLLSLEGREHYTEMKSMMENLLSKVVEIPTDDGWLMTQWVVKARYIEGAGKLQLRFAAELKPYLLQLKNAFTSYKLNTILPLKSVYSIRLYELMKKWQQVQKWSCTVEELRGKLGAFNKSYDLYGNFKNRVLEPSVTDLNSQTDLLIEYNEVKKGRKVVQIEFIIKKNNKAKVDGRAAIQPPANFEAELLKAELIRERLNKVASGYQMDAVSFSEIHSMATSIWNEAAEAELGMLIEYVNEDKSVHNPLGFIISKVKKALDMHNQSVLVTFAELKPQNERQNSRVEALPDWFSDYQKELDN